MAAGNWTIYSNAATELGAASLNLSTGTYVLILVTNSYTPAPNTDSTYANVSADEVATGSGYTVGGQVMSQTWSLSSATSTFTSSNVAWSTFTATGRYGVIVHRAGASLASTDLLVAYSDLGGGSSFTGAGGTFTVAMNASGIFNITHSP
jgi:hypothetical protein